MKMDYILEIKNISMEFPGIKALDDISLSISRGEVHAIVGENGAGKSTMMKILSGVYQPTSGELFFDGKAITFNKPKDAQDVGISIIHQEFSLVPYLNAVENIFLGNEILNKLNMLDKQLMKKKAKELMKKLDAEIDLDVPVNQLSVANQQFVEIAKAISTETKILIFDEPTASLTGKEVDKLFELIHNMKEHGVTILYISHHLDEIFTIADRFTCLRDGTLVETKNVKDSNKEEMVRLMVGREVTSQFPERQIEVDDNVILNVKNLTNENVKGISFQLRKGEALGIAGLVGSGRTETIRALIGADKCQIKDVEMFGQKVNLTTPTDAIKHGIGLIPESRKTQGLIIDMPIRENITITFLDDLLGSIPLINRRKERNIVEKSIKELSIKATNMNQKVKNLSGGNQQKVVLAKWLNRKLNVLIFDEPTRGIDIGAKEEIYKLIRKLTEEGLSVIIISSELPEVIGLSDRVLAMYKGKVAAEIDKSEATQENIMYYCTGGVKNARTEIG